jgi:hypothetical protein
MNLWTVFGWGFLQETVVDARFGTRTDECDDARDERQYPRT